MKHVRYLALSFILVTVVSLAGLKLRNSGLAINSAPELLYQNDLSGPEMVQDWVMEGPGKIEFRDGWMEMYAPNEEYHHVFWCPRDFPSSFQAEWDAQNLKPEAGLVIIFFAAQGVEGQDIFHPELPLRDGTFKAYIKDQLRSYHISYYANSPQNPERATAHLRKNPLFALVQEAPEGILKHSTAVHHCRLIKQDNHIQFYVDDRKVIDWTDDGKKYGPVWGEGKIGFRQMQWTHFRYRNFKVWEVKGNKNEG